MARSMTGFGTATAGEGAVAVVAEVRSTNHRFLKVSIHAPRHLESASAAIEAYAKSKLARGAVDVSLKGTPDANATLVKIDSNLVAARVAELEALHAALGAPASKTELVATALRLPGALAAEPSNGTDPILIAHAEAAGKAAVDALAAARETEGAALAAILEQGLVALSDAVRRCVERAPVAVREARDRFATRVNALLSESRPGLVVNDELLLREAAIAADRADIAEEIARLHTHIDHFRAILRDSADVGRRLDFLLQEMLREVNTTGSKSSDVGMAHAVVDAKTCIERLKEQVANLE